MANYVMETSPYSIEQKLDDQHESIVQLRRRVEEVERLRERDTIRREALDDVAGSVRALREDSIALAETSPEGWREACDAVLAQIAEWRSGRLP